MRPPLRWIAALAAGLLGAAAPSDRSLAGQADCSPTALREAQTALRIAAVFVEEGKPKLAQALLQASGDRLASCAAPSAELACPRDLGRARDDVALAYSLLASGRGESVRDLLRRGAAALLAHSAGLEQERRLELRELHQQVTTGFSEPELRRADLLGWWGQLELACLAASEVSATPDAARTQK